MRNAGVEFSFDKDHFDDGNSYDDERANIEGSDREVVLNTTVKVKSKLIEYL